MMNRICSCLCFKLDIRHTLNVSSHFLFSHQRAYMFHFWKPITCQRVLPSSSSPSQPKYEFSQKTPDGSGSFCCGPSACFLCRSLFLHMRYLITHAPAALVSIFRRKYEQAFHACCYRKWEAISSFSAVAAVNIFRVFYTVNYCWRVLMMDWLKWLPFSSQWMMKVAGKTEQRSFCRWLELSVFSDNLKCNSWIMQLDGLSYCCDFFRDYIHTED